MPALLLASKPPSVGIEDTLLRKFDITKHGFLPSTVPLQILSDPYYAPWELLMGRLPALLESLAFRDAVDSLQLLSTDNLQTEEEWRRAYVIMGFLAHGYIWGGERPSEVLPPAITIPLLQVSEHFDLPPTATYAGLCLWNFSSTTGDFTDPDSLKAIHTFTGTEDESWFYTLSVAIEAQCAFVIPSMVKAIEAVHKRDYATITKGLNGMITCVGKLDALLARMYEKCDPMVFYHRIRPYLAGSQNMTKAGLPNGVFYDEGNERGSWRKLMGGSNGQSSLIQFLDIALGVEHSAAGGKSVAHPDVISGTRGKTMGYHETVRTYYMPGPHRRFLKRVSRMDSLRDFASMPYPELEHKQLQKLYDATIKTLGDYRHRHIRIATRYIVIPSTKHQVGTGVNLATASSKSERGTDLTGTGGTSLISFLKQTRDETYTTGCSHVATAIVR